MYSAVKVNGKRLYEYARAGIIVERPTRIADIYSFERMSEPIFDAKKGTQSWRFKVVCGKGTYVRTLSVDLGKKLGFAAHMSNLTRTAAGGMEDFQAKTLDQVAQFMEQGRVEELLLPIEIGVRDFTRINLTQELYNMVKNGMRLEKESLGVPDKATDLVALFFNDQVVSLYHEHPSKPGVWKPSKVLRNN
jgi:tRNA pseudouridine55 synthase